MRSGFSFLEVLVAFVVMSLMLAVLVPQQSHLFGKAAVAPERTLAMDYALSVIEPLGIEEELSIRTDDWIYRKWRITLDVKPDELGNSSSIQTWRIAVEVQNSRGEQLAFVSSHRPR